MALRPFENEATTRKAGESAAPSSDRATEILATILIVEDEAALLELVRQYLQKRNYGVLTAKNGREGVEVFRQHAKKIQLVISDLAMPGMNGLECMERILALEPRVRFLFMSGFPEQIVERHRATFERCEFLPKPFRLDQLLDKVGHLLSRDAAA
ncbi:MAG TPA: response regulator [Candidatus Sulfotelmatobacter sp.]|nr:response regulator [Candidatus Sulfotelmatobacter sp.]